MATKSVLILGFGKRVGASVAAKFASGGYAVAVTSRSAQPGKTPEGYHSFPADLSDPSSIAPVFAAATSSFGSPPGIVIYNAAALTPAPDKDSVLSISAASFVKDLNINTVSSYVAAQEAVKGFEKLKGGVFIYTGNGLNETFVPSPIMVTLGVGKSASAYWVGTADILYASKGYRFFYADERKADGGFASGDLDGPAHAEFYWELAEGSNKDIPWQATFVKGKGYAKF